MDDIVELALARRQRLVATRNQSERVSVDQRERYGVANSERGHRPVQRLRLDGKHQSAVVSRRELQPPLDIVGSSLRHRGAHDYCQTGAASRHG